MTLAYNPVLNGQFGNEYCQVHIDASFGTYSTSSNPEYKGQVPLERSWENAYERSMIERVGLNGVLLSLITEKYVEVLLVKMGGESGWI